MLTENSIGREKPSKTLTRGKGTRVFQILFITASVVVIFCAGGYAGQNLQPPRVITEYEVVTQEKVVEKNIYTPVEKVVETIVYEPVETIVYEQVETPVIREVSKPLAEFETLDGLQEWVNGSGVLAVGFSTAGQGGSTAWDCDDYARNLQNRAITDGYLISFEVIRASEYNTLFTKNKLPAGDIHAINSAIIGNKVYFIEPQTREIVFAVNVD